MRINKSSRFLQFLSNVPQHFINRTSPKYLVKTQMIYFSMRYIFIVGMYIIAYRIYIFRIPLVFSNQITVQKLICVDCCRIDENMDDTLANVEGAQGALLKYLNSISSNRWLMIKIFFVLIFFLMVFLFFVAQSLKREM